MMTLSQQPQPEERVIIHTSRGEEGKEKGRGGERVPYFLSTLVRHLGR